MSVMTRFTPQAPRYSGRAPRFGPYVPLPPGVLPDQTLLTQTGDGLTGEDGRYLLLELAVGEVSESAILTETANLLLSQDSLYLTYE